MVTVGPIRLLLRRARAFLGASLIAVSIAANAQAPVASGGGNNAAAAARAINRSAVQLQIKLPYPAGARYRVLQGVGGTFSHTRMNYYAIDFGMPEGSDVCASADGQVVRLKQDSAAGGTSSRNFGDGNSVVIDHGNGLFTQYLHLAKGSVQVLEGDIVRSGQVIAHSGNTGFSSTPHLHFQVQDALGQSLPAAFLDVPGDGIPRQGRFYTSGNDGRDTSAYAGVSLLPLDTFLRNGISLSTCTMPAHRLRTTENYVIEGTAESRARRVALFVMGPGGGRPIFSILSSTNPDGKFSISVGLDDLRRKAGNWSPDLTQSNPFTFAIAPVRRDGSYWSEFSVPITLR